MEKLEKIFENVEVSFVANEEGRKLVSVCFKEVPESNLGRVESDIESIKDFIYVSSSNQFCWSLRVQGSPISDVVFYLDPGKISGQPPV